MIMLLRTATLVFILFAVLSGISYGAAEKEILSRSLHYLKDVAFTKTLDSAKLTLVFSGPVSYRISERNSGKTGKQLTILIENCVVNPRLERIQPDRKFIAALNATNNYKARSGISTLITISSYREVKFRWSEATDPFRIVVTMVRTESSPQAEPSQTNNTDSAYRSAAVQKDAVNTLQRVTAPKTSESTSTGGNNEQAVTPVVKEPTTANSVSTQMKIPTTAVPYNDRDRQGLPLIIVIDPGHGGKDKGATGVNGVYEKDLTLMTAYSLKRAIEKTLPNVKVELTRYRDEYLSLEKRVKIANSLKADLFISLHFNAHENPSVRGIETYYLNISQDKEAARVAAIENAVLKRKMTDLEAILQDLLKASSIAESAKLARVVHNQMVDSLKSLSPDIRDLGVKSAPFYVLFGITMPGILIEAGFISNKEELSLIQSPEFAQAVANGIIQGVKLYAKEIHQGNVAQENKMGADSNTGEAKRDRDDFKTIPYIHNAGP